jgi:hypothetical protein
MASRPLKSKFPLTIRNAGPLAFSSPEHHIQQVRDDRAGDSEEYPRVPDRPAIHEKALFVWLVMSLLAGWVVCWLLYN